MTRSHLVVGMFSLALSYATAPLPGHDAVPDVEGFDRPADQTFLTYPEWFLVFSPAELARHLDLRLPSEFPYVGHIDQYWESYDAVSRATEDQPYNAGYHMMLWVIGGSTTAEYAIKAVWERLFGRFTEILAGGPHTPDDRVAAGVAKRYVDFIVHSPWYAFDFQAALGTLWQTQVPTSPLALLRSLERRYSLTTEYLAKSLYASVIARATEASYAPTRLDTRVALRGPVPTLAGEHSIVVLERTRQGDVITVPRYQPFTDHASALARAGADFRSIAGNVGPILLTVVADDDWVPPSPVLFSQPLLSETGRRRYALVSTVPELAALLRLLGSQPVEHIFDY